MRIPEILAPAGNWEMAEAAMAAGCDGIYVGAKNFGARAFSDNFSEEELQKLIQEAHKQGVKVFLTVNTLLKSSELDDAFALINRMEKEGLDAVILQDLGLIARLRRELPDLPRHASTQLSVYSLAGAKVLHDMGFQRIVLGREITKEETQRIRQEVPIEIEVFAHGSLCVSVSGQCFLSSFAGGRSGNRGRCAQPCRKIYTLERSNGQRIGDADTYLSPRDLMTLSEAETYEKMGVDSLKIEGRMKKPEYVYAAVRAYREALELQKNASQVETSRANRSHSPSVRRYPAGESLKLMTNRPFTKGFFFHDFGTDYGFSRKQQAGRQIGRIESRNPEDNFHSKKDEVQKFVRTHVSLFPGDMLMLQGKRGEFPYTVTEEIGQGECLFLPQKDLSIGSTVRQVFTETVRKDLAETLLSKQKKIPIFFAITIRVGERLQVKATALDTSVTVYGSKVEPAHSFPLDEDTVKRSFQKLGATQYSWGGMVLFLDSEAFVPVRLLNELRREVCDQMLARLSQKNAPSRRKNLASFSFFASDFSLPTFSLNQSCLSESRVEVPKILFETDQMPTALGQVPQMVDIVRLSDISLYEAWKKTGAAIEWKFPLLQDALGQRAWLRALFAIDPHPNAIYCETWNEVGAVLSFEDVDEPRVNKRAKGSWNTECGRLKGVSKPENSQSSRRLSMVLGAGINLMNEAALRSLALFVSGEPVIRLTPSIELTAKELHAMRFRPCPWELPATVQTPGMVLRHCPASLLKGCTDDSNCKKCVFREDIWLCDAFGKRRLVRQDGYTTLFSPERIDFREAPSLLLDLHPAVIRIQDMGEGTEKIISDWKKILATNAYKNRKWQNAKANQVGHFINGIQ